MATDISSSAMKIIIRSREPAISIIPSVAKSTRAWNSPRLSPLRSRYPMDISSVSAAEARITKLMKTRKRSTAIIAGSIPARTFQRNALAAPVATSPARAIQATLGRDGSERLPFWATSTISTSMAQTASTISGRSAQK
jgi:hypothetical protein